MGDFFLIFKFGNLELRVFDLFFFLLYFSVFGIGFFLLYWNNFLWMELYGNLFVMKCFWWVLSMCVRFCKLVVNESLFCFFIGIEFVLERFGWLF